VRQLAGHDHQVAVYHRGQTRAVLPAQVQQFTDASSVMPIQKFPAKLFEFRPEVVILTITMGAVDGHAAADAFRGRAGRLVLVSSGDVYRAYGRFVRIEPGPIDRGLPNGMLHGASPNSGLLNEDAPLRSVLFPYRHKAPSPQALEYWYEKILAERAVFSAADLPGTVLRLPKVYGPGSNDDLATVYRYRGHPNWRWTHGFVENIAAAVELAAIHPSAGGRIYNVGEIYTPTVAERLAGLPPSSIEPDLSCAFDFTQDIAYDTTRIRSELGYREPVPEKEALQRTLESGRSEH